MNSVLTSCTANVTFIHNGELNALLPMLDVTIEVKKGRELSQPETFSFSGAPSSMKMLIATIQEVLQAAERTTLSTPKMMTEEQWFAYMQKKDDVVEAPTGPDGQ